MASVTGIVETCLYVEELPRSAAFYERVLGFQKVWEDERGCGLCVADRQMLLLFKKGASTTPMNSSGGLIPPHDGDGNLHIGFAIPASELSDWTEKLAAAGIPVESRVAWPKGGRSLYFRDPDGHLVELLTPKVWPVY